MNTDMDKVLTYVWANFKLYTKYCIDALMKTTIYTIKAGCLRVET
jgi:hypothetical protein